MKKSVAFVLLSILILSLVPQILADETNGAESTTTSTESTTTSTNTEATNKEKIDKGFQCLEEKVGNCASMTTQEIALTLLATPKTETFDSCLAELEKKKSTNNWGNVRDTALAILALNHAGVETKDYEEWILSKARNPTDLIWYLQQDSNSEVECNIGYNSNDYSIKISENKKIDKNAGSCLSLAQSNFWLRIAPECLENKYIVECNQNFIANLLYKNQNSPTIYVLEGTESATAFGKIELEVKSKCFGDNACDYEATAWATLALLKTGHDATEYIPYIIAMSDTNKRFLPEAFIYASTNYDDYAKKLMESQKLGNYWEAHNSAYNRFYDTSLAVLSVGQSSSEQITKAKDWLLFSQGSNGCWQNSVRETAIVLWALANRPGRGNQGSGSSVTYCTQAGYFCISKFECPDEQNIGENYFCQGDGARAITCCETQNIRTCSEYDGRVCSSTEVCIGNERKATDTDFCCTGTCTPKSTETECEENYFVCRASCSETQEEVGYSCDEGSVCCRTKTTTSSGGSKLWIWILIILILIVLGAIAWIKREELKLWFFKMKAKFKKDKGSSGSNQSSPMGPGPRPGMPPTRPGFPPNRRPIMPQARPRPQNRRPEMDETFKKLKDMAK